MLLKQLKSADLDAAQQLRDQAFFQPLNLDAKMSLYNANGVCVYGYDQDKVWVGSKPEAVAREGVNVSEPDLLERALQCLDSNAYDALVTYGLFDAEELVGLTIFHACFNTDNSQYLSIDLLAVKATNSCTKQQCAVELLTQINEKFKNQYTSINLNHRKNFNVTLEELTATGNNSRLIKQEFVALSVILSCPAVLQTPAIAIPPEEPLNLMPISALIEEKSAKFPWDKLALLLVVVGGGVIIGLAAAGLFLSLWTIIPALPLLIGVFIGIKIIYDKFYRSFQGDSRNTNSIPESDSLWCLDIGKEINNRQRKQSLTTENKSGESDTNSITPTSDSVFTQYTSYNPSV